MPNAGGKYTRTWPRIRTHDLPSLPLLRFRACGTSFPMQGSLSLFVSSRDAVRVPGEERQLRDPNQHFSDLFVEEQKRRNTVPSGRPIRFTTKALTLPLRAKRLL